MVSSGHGPHAGEVCGQRDQLARGAPGEALATGRACGRCGTPGGSGWSRARRYMRWVPWGRAPRIASNVFSTSRVHLRGTWSPGSHGRLGGPIELPLAGAFEPAAFHHHRQAGAVDEHAGAENAAVERAPIQDDPHAAEGLVARDHSISPRQWANPTRRGIAWRGRLEPSPWHRDDSRPLNGGAV